MILLGAQVGLKNGVLVPAYFTEMRATAAGIAYDRGISPKVVISGGYNVGVRYDAELSVPVFGTAKSDRKPDFSDEARKKARLYRSEASIIAEFMQRYYGLPPESIILEEDSENTRENAQYCKGIVERSGWKEVGLITQLYHMERALLAFEEVGLKVVPLFAEDLLPFEDNAWIDKVCAYYSVPKGGKQWDTRKMRELLSKRQTIGFLMT